MSFFANRSSSRGVPTSPANRPREMSSGESSPPYDPSQPATASTSTPNAHKISLGKVISFLGSGHVAGRGDSTAGSAAGVAGECVPHRGGITVDAEQRRQHD